MAPKKRKRKEPSEEPLDETITYEFRRLQTVPHGLHEVLEHGQLAPLFDHAATQLRLFLRLGSAFVCMHVLRLHDRHRPLPKMTGSYVRQLFVAACGGSVPDDRDVRVTLRDWRREGKARNCRTCRALERSLRTLRMRILRRSRTTTSTACSSTGSVSADTATTSALTGPGCSSGAFAPRRTSPSSTRWVT
mmetsp:Transcript_21313/g.65777  ORF Transcript_21313/g.65777 Transcript_21313/m.65777 type:complete len:191 (+) Transcript_21313:48-620(+)